SDEPAILIAHSAGCLTVAIWAHRHPGPIRGALLVTPPYLDPDWTPDEKTDRDTDTDTATDTVTDAERNQSIVGPQPLNPLPFRSILVASRTDPWATFEQAGQWARAWGSEIYDAGDAGHLETANGYGPWPAGEELVRRLAAQAEEPA